MPSVTGLRMGRAEARPNNVDEMLELVKLEQGTEVLLRAEGVVHKLRYWFDLDGQNHAESTYEMWLFGLERWQSLGEPLLRQVLGKHGPYTATVLRYDPAWFEVRGWKLQKDALGWIASKTGRVDCRAEPWPGERQEATLERLAKHVLEAYPEEADAAAAH